MFYQGMIELDYRILMRVAAHCGRDGCHLKECQLFCYNCEVNCEFIFHLNCASCDAHWADAEGGLPDRCLTDVGPLQLADSDLDSPRLAVKSQLNGDNPLSISG